MPRSHRAATPTVEDARRRLGLSLDANPADHLDELRAKRERLAALVRKARNETRALRHQDSLIAFDRALALVREQEATKSHTSSAARRTLHFLASLLLLFGPTTLILLRQHRQEQARTRLHEQTLSLDALGAKMIEARQWPEAEAAYQEIERLIPGNPLASHGLRNIQSGKEEERRQFIEYWSGEANTAFELGRSDDATQAALKVLEKYPDQKEIRSLLKKIEQARSTRARQALATASNDALRQRNWDEAEKQAKALLSTFPGDPDGLTLLTEARRGRDKENRARIRAGELFAAAKLRDQGNFDQQALDWLREANSLAPHDPEIAALYQKMAAYTRTLHVPGDFTQPADAINAARNGDRIVLAEGKWAGPVVVDKPLSIEGAGHEKTSIEIDATTSAAATFTRNASDSRVSGITFRHRGFDPGPDRYPAVLIRGSTVTLLDCRASDAAGHGLAVIENAKVEATRCSFENNGWDGVAVHGVGSHIILNDCEAIGNFGHGFDLWDGGGGTLRQCLARDNSRNGILIDTNAADIVLDQNDLRANREYGIVLAAAKAGRIHDNHCHENLLGGLVIRIEAAPLTCEKNRLDRNLGPGLSLERGLAHDRFSNNLTQGNRGENTVINADFSHTE
ncbi:MAG: hypothetical protein EAZ84_03840 [Verrucomicrobia bacterium]|nr:MAG: hypothetical protein EAZ84_03840 [Verrucomicrobiota bacterium]TAE86544.1 MAG: hypothetical protein EAZ82_10985 [Verrucomicrobiota bacterium]TAF24239.1 MAG: hypothetical protein EAZ71_11760 [Verrucomicrobiota bacterium]